MAPVPTPIRRSEADILKIRDERGYKRLTTWARANKFVGDFCESESQFMLDYDLNALIGRPSRIYQQGKDGVRGEVKETIKLLDDASSRAVGLLYIGLVYYIPKKEEETEEQDLDDAADGAEYFAVAVCYHMEAMVKLMRQGIDEGRIELTEGAFQDDPDKQHHHNQYINEIKAHINVMDDILDTAKASDDLDILDLDALRKHHEPREENEEETSSSGSDFFVDLS